uniref:BPTI/Kunitz inhibitor domain-containing protein n=1 Tax=Plectus sambesii TaxID=2011161 RepID=A0A914UPI6_9BILA
MNWCRNHGAEDYESDNKSWNDCSDYDSGHNYDDNDSGHNYDDNDSEHDYNDNDSEHDYRDNKRTVICLEPLAKGFCRGLEWKYYFDSASKSCSQFGYTGCGGNNNNFEAEFQCQLACAPLLAHNGSGSLGSTEPAIMKLKTTKAATAGTKATTKATTTSEAIDQGATKSHYKIDSHLWEESESSSPSGPFETVSGFASVSGDNSGSADPATMEPKTTKAGTSATTKKPNATTTTKKASDDTTSKAPQNTGSLLSALLLGFSVLVLFQKLYDDIL